VSDGEGGPVSDSKPSFAIVGLGEVGSTFARHLQQTGHSVIVASRESKRSKRAAAEVNLALESARDAAAKSDIVLLTTTGQALVEVMGEIAPVLRPETIVADLTSASPADVQSAATMVRRDELYIDVAIMGAVSLHGAETPLLASGPGAPAFADAMNACGFAVDVLPRSQAGDACKMKLLRSVFAKGLDAVVIETMLAAEALGLREELIEQLKDYDRSPLRDHIAMYLRTHPVHASRRLFEMEQVERELRKLGLLTFTTRAAIERYRRSAAFSQSTPVPSKLDAPSSLAWLLQREREARAEGPGEQRGVGQVGRDDWN
jgi:3-hydroxyisobutyrate dehydrogenase-like beta-hydroxyacid dehydrogenase